MTSGPTGLGERPRGECQLPSRISTPPHSHFGNWPACSTSSARIGQPSRSPFPGPKRSAVEDALSRRVLAGLRTARLRSSVSHLPDAIGLIHLDLITCGLTPRKAFDPAPVAIWDNRHLGRRKIACPLPQRPFAHKSFRPPSGIRLGPGRHSPADIEEADAEEADSRARRVTRTMSDATRNYAGPQSPPKRGEAKARARWGDGTCLARCRHSHRSRPGTRACGRVSKA
jgi:hypothetical protein